MVIMCCMLIGIPIAYVDPTEGGLNPVFWGCAIGVLAIILYRKRQRKKQDQNLSK